MTLDDTQLVLAARSGDEAAFAELVDRWLDRCWDVAWRIVRDRDRAADVAQETMITAWQQLARLERPESFGGWVLRISRNRALNLLDRERRSVPAGDAAVLDDHQPDPRPPGSRLESAERDELVWAAAAALGERDASVLDLHLRHGLGPAELAAELAVTPNHAHQLLFRLRGRLGTAIRAWVLWRRGRPRCEDLGRVLQSAGHERFDAAAARVIDRHASGCARCDDDRHLVLDPAALFASVPVASVPGDLRGRLIRSIRAAGVPTGSSDVSGVIGGARRGRRRLVAAALLAAALAAALLVGGSEPADELATEAGNPTGPQAPTTTTTAASGATSTTSTTAAPSTAPPPAPTGTEPEPTGPVSDAPPPPSTPAGPQPAPTVPPPPPTATTTTTTSTEAPTTTVAPPQIDAFTVVESRQDAAYCARQGMRGSTPYDVRWATSHATTVALSHPQYGTEQVPATGHVLRCAERDTAFLLTATGSGGTATASQLAR